MFIEGQNNLNREAISPLIKIQKLNMHCGHCGGSKQSDGDEFNQHGRCSSISEQRVGRSESVSSSLFHQRRWLLLVALSV